MGGPSLPDRIAQCYYTHGLFCSSHPVFTIGCAIVCFLVCCFPLINIPLPGSIPQKIFLPYKHSNIQMSFSDAVNQFIQADSTFSKEQTKQSTENLTKNVPIDQINASINLSVIMNETVNLPYLWAKEEPLLFIQQIVLKTGVWPWHDELKLSDAFRAPLQEVFRLVEIIRNHQHPESGTSLGHICFHVESVKRNVAAHKESPVLPEYSCLLLSPANLWQQNIERFLLDANILNTVFNHQNLQKGKVSLAEMMFGMHLKDTGIKRYPLRARPRALQYSVTIFFQSLNDNFINSLKEKLLSVYPVHHKWDKSQTTNQIMLIYYPGEFNYQEFVPLCVSFVGLFIYIHFSVRKLEFVQSKLGLAVAAVASVAASFVMTVGICFFFGLTLSFQGKEIFPYLVILVGIENVFVLTKSVMSIDFKLDVKIRLAQGLSKEGWSITKNLLIEITILTISLFTFVPVIQQFSIFMIVSLLSDFFLQMLFFTTVLGIDIRRKEVLREKISEFQINQHSSSNQGKLLIHNLYSHPNFKISRSKSHPRLNGLNYQPHPHADVVANLHQDPVLISTEQIKKVPKRIRLVKIWARTRFFQRAFMIWMVVWISMIIYNSGIIENIFDITNSTTLNKTENPEVKSSTMETPSKLGRFVSLIDENNKTNQSFHSYNSVSVNYSVLNDQKKIDKSDLENMQFNAEILNKTLHFISLRHLTYPQPWLRLSEFHWSSILSQYNVSFRGRYLTVLPPILLKHRVTPEKAVAIRNPAEKDSMTPPSRWRALIAALDPLDLTDFEIDDGINIPLLQSQNWRLPQTLNEAPYYPNSPVEVMLLAILCLISVIVIVYTMVVLYGCVCTKNYAEWRTSWKTLEKETHTRPALQFVMEAVPIIVKGHTQEIECLATNGDSVVSSCLQGQLKMWNPSNGELIANIDRHVFFGLQRNICRTLRCQETTESEYKVSDNLDFSPTKAFSIEDNNSVVRKRIYSKPSFALHESDDLVQEILVPDDLDSINESSTNIDIGCRPQDVLKSQISHNPAIYRKMFDGDTPAVRETIKINSNLCQIGHFRHVSSEFSNVKKAISNENVKSLSSPISNIINDSSCPPSIWCMDFADNLIVLGCSDGRLEFWEASTSKFKCIFDDGFGAGVSNVKLLEGLSGCGMHVVVARLTGHLDLLLLETSSPTQKFFKKSHIRTGSAGSVLLTDESTHHRFSHEQEHIHNNNPFKSPQTAEEPSSSFDLNIKNREDTSEKIHCRKLVRTRAHQQSITVLECDWGRILSGSQDHTLKVFLSHDLSGIYTLHGHCGPITCAFIDRFWPMVSGSGSEDGLLCVWDLTSGACLYSMQAHDGPITGLVYSESYVISMGADERLCIWDRFRGHLLNSMNIGQCAGGCGMLTLTHSLVITGGRGGLVVWDASTGEAVRKVVLGPSDGYVFVRQILPLKDAIVCDYANELRIIRFPIISRIDREYERKND